MKTINKHILFWSAYFLVAYLTDLILDPATTFVGEVLFFSSQNLFLFYSLLFFARRVSFKTKIAAIKSVGLLMIIITLFYAMRYVIRYYLLNKYLSNRFGEMPLDEWFTIGLTWIVHYLFYAFGYFYFQSAIQKQKELRIKDQLQLKTEQEKLSLENERLRAQINPHFLFNTLNYFYNKTSSKMPEVSDGISALADIMRSAIRKPDEDGLIPLDEEVINIDQLISIYQLRYNNNVYISFTKEGSVAGLRILPHILNTLVENGFKHGDLHKADHPLSIDFKITGKSIQFSVHNKIRRGPKEISHGIGMTYIRTHLDSIYEDGYELAVNEDNEFYTVTLNIDLSVASQPVDAFISDLVNNATASTI
jgi:two-component system, LytTR family, sensor kinase